MSESNVPDSVQSGSTTNNAAQENLCQLSGSLMTDPVKTPYGHVFDRQALSDWLQFSQTDPICGQPLNMNDCVPYGELQEKIFKIIIKYV